MRKPEGRAHVRAEVQRAPDDGHRAAPPAATGPRRLRQLGGRHARRPERGAVEAVVGVEPPAAVVEEPALGLEALVERRLGVRHQDVEGGEGEPILDGPFDGGADRIDRVVVVAEGERGPRLEAVAAERRDGAGVPVEAGQVRALVHLAQVLGIRALEPDDIPQAAARHEEFHELRVSDLVDARLGDPADPERDESLQERLGGLGIGDEVVVDEEEVAPRLGPDLGHHLLHGARVDVVVEVRPDRAELAAIPAAAAELEEREGEVAFALEKVAARPAAGLRRADRGVVPRAEPPVVRVRDHLGPERLGVAREDRVGVAGDLVGDQRRVHAPHHDRDAPGPVLRGDLVRAAGGEGLHGDRDEIGRLVVVDPVDAVVEELDVDPGRRQAGQDAELERLHPGLVDERRAVGQTTQRGLDECDPHAPPPAMAGRRRGSAASTPGLPRSPMAGRGRAGLGRAPRSRRRRSTSRSGPRRQRPPAPSGRTAAASPPSSGARPCRARTPRPR